MINLRNYTKLLQTIGNSDEQYIVICDKQGKKVDYRILTDVSKTEEYYFYIEQPYFRDKENLIHISNHAPLYVGNLYIGQPFYLYELVLAELGKWEINIMVDEKYIYILDTKKTTHGGDEIKRIFHEKLEKTKETWRQMVCMGNIGLKKYLDSVSHAVLLGCAKELGWYYERMEHGYYDLKINHVIIPPREMPRWLYDDEKYGWDIIKENNALWKELMVANPKLRKYNFDVNAVEYTPYKSKHKVDLQNI